MTDDRSQMTDDRSQMTDDRSQKTGDGRQKSEVRGQMTDTPPLNRLALCSVPYALRSMPIIRTPHQQNRPYP